jgi:UDP-GlcNAc:undecaprenyl-phosphate/decaprenyl-phosphate GlcNAc-1-phosphate transferase
MIDSVPHYILYIASIIASAVISVYAVRKIIFIMTRRRIFDTPDHTRKIHGADIPTLGGIGIFVGYIVVATFFMYLGTIAWYHIIASSTLLFFTGIYDDLMNMRPSKKLAAQLLAAAITIYFADIRIVSFYGLFGIGDLPYWASIALTLFCCTLFINAFNFVDGIDGLACSLAILYTGLLGVLFAMMSSVGMVGIAIGLAGATAGLLFYNIAPAKIYMGDTGSMFLGFTIFVLSLIFINTYTESGKIIELIHSRQGALVVASSILFLPLYDAFRVFIIRMSRGISPLKADRTHLHYYLLDAGFSHSQSVLIILTTNVVIIAAGFFMQDLNPLATLAAITFVASAVLFFIYRRRQKRLAK